MDKRGVRALGGLHFGGSFVEGNDGGGGFSCLNLELHSFCCCFVWRGRTEGGMGVWGFCRVGIKGNLSLV